MDATLINYLKKPDLTEPEAKLYLLILSLGGGKTFRELAQILGVNRSTTFVNTESLIEKGLVIKTIQDSKTIIIPNEPKTILEDLVDKQIKAAKNIQEQLPEITNALQEKYSPFKKLDDVQIKHYKGELGVKKIYEDALKTNELRSIVNFDSGIILPDIEETFFQIYDKNPDFIMYDLCIDTPAAIQYPLRHKKRYFRKFIPPNIKFSTVEILIYDEKVSIINFNNKIVGTTLHNTDYYVNSKGMFDFIWQLLPETA